MAWQLGLIALGPIGWAAAAVTTAATVGYGIYKACSDDDTSSTSPAVEKYLMLFRGEQAAGKSALFHWIVNNSFDKEDYVITEKHNRKEGYDFIAYDTSGTLDADTEKLKNEIFKNKNYKIVYVFDVSKYDSKETRHWLNMLLKEKREGENAGFKIDIIAIGTHANKSGLSKEQIASLEKEIRDLHQVKCRIYELNPDDTKDFHPTLSSSEIKKYILG